MAHPPGPYLEVPELVGILEIATFQQGRVYNMYTTVSFYGYITPSPSHPSREQGRMVLALRASERYAWNVLDLEPFPNSQNISFRFTTTKPTPLAFCSCCSTCPTTRRRD